MDNQVFVKEVQEYSSQAIYESLPASLFEKINKNSKIVIKPNWVRQHHQLKEFEWDYIITHPTLVTAVLLRVLERVGKGGRISILDSPETASSFKQILDHYPTEEWKQMAFQKGVPLEIIDLRDVEWLMNENAIIDRKTLEGDIRGKTEINLQNISEFYGHKKSAKGYYGADYDIKETNLAHDGINNIYRVSRTVLESDVFINLPKLKTHKKSGITCCLKNLVGVNTYKNYLPHYSIGSPDDEGDQFPIKSIKNTLESKLLTFTKQHILMNPVLAKIISPIFKLGKVIFGETNNIVRSGNWYGNDTLWRMIIDLNKIVLYSNPDGTMKEDNLINRKIYIGIVDAVICGEKNGPKSPDPKKLSYLIYGTNPVAIDATASCLMSFNPLKIPAIEKAFQIKKYKIVDFEYSAINVMIAGDTYTLQSVPEEFKSVFEPHFGWKNQIEFV
jgi:uncharacterized protein (DUF362 family)